jgi:integrase
MERSQRPYAIYKRATKKKKNDFRFYVRFRGEEGRYLTGVSSGQSSRAAAANWADAELAKGRIITPGKRGVTFGTFVEGFWNYEGDYITRKLARGGHFSRSFALIRASQLKRHILPTFKVRPLRAITRLELETWMMKLYREGALEPATINRCIDNMKVILKEACRRGFIGADPAAGLERLAEHSHPRGILWPAEIRLLFGPDALETHWAGARPLFAAAFLGIAAGLRMGEVRALRVQDVQSEFVTITGSWEESYGRKGAKWDSERVVPIPSRVAEQLDALVLGSRYRDPDDLVFPGYCRTVPLDKHRIQNAFYSALKGIGIDEAVRRERGLVWHSTRHTFNSLMRGKIDGGKLMRIVGHRNESTNLRYVHTLPEDLIAVRGIQESIFSVVEKQSQQATEKRSIGDESFMEKETVKQ